ncbi:MAG: proline--tRNA ligase [Rickettsiales bacterium]
MYLSNYFLPILKEDPKEATIMSHRLMLRAGMIRQLTSGIYTWLPLGLTVLKKIEQIIRDEMNNAGAIEILMPCIQPVDLWRKSGRYGTDDDLSQQMLKIKDRNETDLTFAPTAEEVICDMFRNNVQSYKDLPKNLYQIQWKFRDEIRPRFGVMRGREFLMKDSYSFNMNQEEALATYKEMLLAYLKSFQRMGLTAVPVVAPTGAIGGNYSHEFHILAETGESKVFYEADLITYLEAGDITLEGLQKFYANEEEKHDPTTCNVAPEKLNERRGIEVGHIFYLGDKYSKCMDVKVQDKDGQLKYPEMGCYGIGVSRLIGAIIEANHDDSGIIWPASVSPFDVGIINLKPGQDDCDNLTTELYNSLRAAGKDVLVDDSDDSAGAKFSKMDLIGLPWQVTVGPRGAKEQKVEVKMRRTHEKHELSIEAAVTMLTIK